MAKYVLVYYGGSMPETEAEQAAVMKAWGEWFGGLGAAVVDGGNPFSGQVNTVDVEGSGQYRTNRQSTGDRVQYLGSGLIVGGHGPGQELPTSHQRRRHCGLRDL